MDTQEVLAAALEELELNGWCKGVLVDSKGRHCAVGALLTVLDSQNANQARCSEEFRPAINALSAAIPENVFPNKKLISPPSAVVAYNNMCCRSIDEVFDWFTRAKEFC